METTKAAMMVEFVWKAASTSGTPGAKNEDPSGLDTVSLGASGWADVPTLRGL